MNNFKARRRGWLPPEAETKFRIVLTVLESDKPVTVSDIARNLKVTRQLAGHHVKKMVESGLLIKEDTKYRCQHPLYNVENLLNRMWPVISEMVEHMNFEQCADPEQALVENLAAFFAIMSFEEKK